MSRWDLIKKHEGRHVLNGRHLPYRDTEGNLTIGYGRNLDAIGLSEEESDMLLINDMMRTERELQELYPWYRRMDQVRQDVILSMAFMGVRKVGGFKRMIGAIIVQDWETAALELLDSLYAKQVKGRALELAQMLRTGAYVVQV
jgi:lysozyme